MQYQREDSNVRARRYSKKKKKRNMGFLVGYVTATCSLFVLILLLIIQMRADTGRMKEQLDGIDSRVNQVQEELGMTQQGDAPTAGDLQVQKDPAVPANAGAKADMEGVFGPESYAALWGLEQVDKPRDRSVAAVLQRLKELGDKSRLIANIYNSRLSYPDKMLEALANNPEMADFVSGYTGYVSKPSGGFTEDELSRDFPLFLQWDPRWGYVDYGNESCIGLSGCGPTCLSMALFYLTRDETLTPDKIAAYSMKNGYYVSGKGTAWALMTNFPGAYGVKVGEPAASEQKLKAELDQGKIVICSMSKGEFTAAGHFVVIYGYDRDGFKINDSNCVARSLKRWSYEEISDQIKHVWTFWKEEAG